MGISSEVRRDVVLMGCEFVVESRGYCYSFFNFKGIELGLTEQRKIEIHVERVYLRPGSTSTLVV